MKNIALEFILLGVILGLELSVLIIILIEVFKGIK